MRPSRVNNTYTAWLWQIQWLILLAGWTTQVHAQPDTTIQAPRQSITRLLIPSVVIGAGLYTLSDNHPLNRYRIRQDLLASTDGYRTNLDDYLRYGPTLLLAGLTAAGVKGRSTPLDRTGLWITANGISGLLTLGLKQTTGVLRPDGSNRFSFPSGHTSAAFVGAGVLDREFGKTSVLIPIAGYAMAGSTGYLRMVNDKHWISDVLVGAGIGLLSTEAAYHVYPWLKRKLTRRRYRQAAFR